jgi:arsenical pump membrane protein
MHVLAIAIAAAALLGVLIRPLRVNIAWWAAGGALLLVVSGALSARDAVSALARGLDVYLFLIGMMALAEFARREDVFTWAASAALVAARGSRRRLLALVYGVGILTTAFLSNDATIVVLTPAVLDALRRTDADPVPYVVACALIANAASLILPIANPSNLIFFAGRMPSLGAWFASFAAPSVVSIALTYAVLAWIFRRSIAAPLGVKGEHRDMPRPAALVTLGLSAIVLVATAALSGPLGAVACGLGIVAAIVAATRERAAPLRILRGIAWSIVVLTAGLFVLVDALEHAGADSLARQLFAWAEHTGGPAAAVVVALATAGASILLNNLPVGLDVGHTAATSHPATALVSAALVGVNIGPNFSTNGSLATVLWLAILQRAGVAMSPLRFAAIGLVVTPPALIAAALLAR